MYARNHLTFIEALCNTREAPYARVEKQPPIEYLARTLLESRPSRCDQRAFSHVDFAAEIRSDSNPVVKFQHGLRKGERIFG